MTLGFVCTLAADDEHVILPLGGLLDVGEVSTEHVHLGGFLPVDEHAGGDGALLVGRPGRVGRTRCR